jgi:hypothetical protein
LNQTLFRTIVFEFPGSRNHNSDPGSVLKALKQAIKNRKDITGAWVIVDTDNWQTEQFDKLYEWEKQNSIHGLAISNPCFELWLLLHFTDNFPPTQKLVKEALEKEFPDWKKPHCPTFTEEMVKEAVQRAKRANINSNNTPGSTTTGTTVYKLLDILLKNRSPN